MFKPGLRPPEAKVACDLGGAAQTKSSGKGSGLKRRVLFVSASLLAVAGMGLGAIQISSGARTAGATSRPAEVTNAFKFAVVINRPPGPPQVATGQTNFHGQPVFASCVACHTTTKPNLESRRTEDLDQFHQGLKYNHGNLTCLSCHNSTDYDTLRLADTRAVEFSDSMTLCSQCHGPQRRDYDLGLHGGMNGHWDLARGGRTRNTCVDCHDPHTPAFPLVLPVLPPRDRVSVQKQISPDASH
jgi:formate-dependent nitrite reductase cytochrome c552 subunit